MPINFAKSGEKRRKQADDNRPFTDAVLWLVRAGATYRKRSASGTARSNVSGDGQKRASGSVFRRAVKNPDLDYLIILSIEGRRSCQGGISLIRAVDLLA
jgi:hypothetical protein